MAFPNTPEETLKYFLFKVMSEEDATRFMSLKEVLAACEEAGPKWQAIYSLSVYLYVIGYFKDTAKLGTYIDQPITKIEDNKYIGQILGSLFKNKEPEEPWSLFLGMLMYGQFFFSIENMNQSKAVLKLVTDDIFLQSYRTQAPIECPASNTTCPMGFVEESINTQAYPFINYGKLLSGLTLSNIFLKEGNHKAAIEAMAKVAECLPTEDVFSQLANLIDICLHRCENIQVELYSNPETCEFSKDSPEELWAALFDSLSAIAALCPVYDLDVVPYSCNQKSSLADMNKAAKDYWAWKFGYIAGQLARIPHASEFVYYAAANGFDEYRPYAVTVQSLLDGNYHENAFGIWLGLAGQGRDELDMDLSAASPASQTYWAMRVGFADSMREKSVAAVQQSPSSIEKLDQIQTAVESSGLRLVRHEQNTTKEHETLNTKLDTFLEVLKLLPDQAAEQYKAMISWPQDMEPLLQEALTAVTFASLPSPVQESLKDAEAYYRSKYRPWAPNMALPQAIEETLNLFFITSLTRYYGEKWVQANFAGYRTQASKWGAYFLRLCSDRRCSKPTQPDITPFFGKRFPSLDYDALSILGQSLMEAAERKNVLGHFGNKDKNRAFLELRELAIVSKDHPSIIKQMVELFGNIKGTA